MPRTSHVAEGVTGGGNCKIRKRIFPPSSSPSSSALQNYRLKRVVFIGKRGGLSTPFPAWKMDAGSPSSTVGASESSLQPPSQISTKERHGPVSARKLANALWELQEIPSPIMRGDLRKKRCKKETRRRERIPSSTNSGSLPPHLSDPSHSPISEVMDRSGSGIHRRRMQWLDSHKPRLNGHNMWYSHSPSYENQMEVELHSRGHTPACSRRGTKSILKDLRKGLNALKEFLKVVSHFGGLEKHHHSYIASIFSASCAELEKARLLVEQLIDDQRREEVDAGHLSKRLMEENVAWKRREQEKIQEGIQLILEEFEIEKKLRRRTERQNEKLGMELAEAKAALSRVKHDLENERRSKEVIEHVCNELVRGLGEDRAEVEEMKRESAKVREELEREREMLQLADTWREERVHMKLTEAKFQLEEKNAAVDQLRNELETFLGSKRSSGDAIENGALGMGSSGSFNSQPIDWVKDITDGGEHHHNANEDDEDAGSVDSDLHSIELNMDNTSKSYRWSFAKGSTLQDMKVSHFEEDDKGRIPNYESLTKNSFSARESTGWPFETRNLPGSHGGLEIGELVDS